MGQKQHPKDPENQMKDFLVTKKATKTLRSKQIKKMAIQTYEEKIVGHPKGPKDPEKKIIFEKHWPSKTWDEENCLGPKPRPEEPEKKICF